ncbi:glycosyl hydrolase [Pseudactinotalea terrae]|uniref:glycosyl hydrolase n=1 Tax=Pseudactinotalea terrae TaxID=1743262 RepID=UPI0012E2C403|nr:glycosyl hydrolase [Pseudactinotalea terrae]
MNDDEQSPRQRLSRRALVQGAAAASLGVIATGGAMAAPARADSGPRIYEAEDAELTGVRVSSEGAGYSGRGFVTGFDATGDAVTFTVDAKRRGLHELRIRYRADAEKYTRLALNGEPWESIRLPESQSFTETAAGRLMLDAGSNTVVVQSNWGYYDIDAIRLTPTRDRPRHKVRKQLVDADASVEARALHSYLVDSYGHRILAGQQELSAVGVVEELTGKKPAVLGLDLMRYSPTFTERETPPPIIEDAIAWSAANGVVTFCWHWNSPIPVKPGALWYQGFYTENTDFDVEHALSHPDSAEHALLLRDIDAIAVQLARLQDNRVPVLFRPLHEAEGGWFWWGAKGPEPAKALYRLLHERLTGQHGIHNLIWVWNSTSPDWYPGSDIVDIVSADVYEPDFNHNPLSSHHEALVSLVDDRKLVALSENGPIPDPRLSQLYGSMWSWFNVWSAGRLTGQNSAEHVRDVYSSPYVVTHDDLPDLASYPHPR